MTITKLAEQGYEPAREQYASMGVNTEETLKILDSVVITLHFWQTDDVGGFETPDTNPGRWSNTKRMALLEILKSMSFGPVYNKYCLSNNIPVAEEYIHEIQ